MSDNILMNKRTEMKRELARFISSKPSLFYKDGQTPIPLRFAEKMVERIEETTDIHSSKRIVVFYSIELAIQMRQWGYNNITLVLDTVSDRLQRCIDYGLISAKIKIVSYKDLESMRFVKSNTVVLGNPPFSKITKSGYQGRTTELYPEFYKWAVENADSVAMIMPRTDQRSADTKHNRLISNTATDIIDTTEGFRSILLKTWCVIADSKSDKKASIDWVIDGKGAKNDLNLAKGKLNVTGDKICLERDKGRKDDITIYHKVSEKFGLVVKYCSPELVPVKKRFPTSGYALLMPQMINSNRGWTKTAIVKCTGREAAMNGMTIAFFETKKQAVAVEKYMKTQEFIDNASRLAGGLGGMTLQAMKNVPINVG